MNDGQPIILQSFTVSSARKHIGLIFAENFFYIFRELTRNYRKLSWNFRELTSNLGE